MTLTDYRTLGRSGLVSPLALGMMILGTKRRGGGEDEARAIIAAYLDAVGNMIDTANIDAGGRSGAMLFGSVADAGAGDRVVLVTEFTRNPGGGPNVATRRS